LLRQPYPLLQCVHEDDVARAVLLALKSAARGAFNLATEETFSFREIIRKRHAIGIPVPLMLARAGLSVAWRLSGWGGESAWLHGLARTLTLDCRRARDELGWRSAATAWQAIDET
jgi:nucleoside-diphosphate-sugar epimerase